MVDKLLLLGGEIGNRQEAGSFGRPIHALATQIKALVGEELGLSASRFFADPAFDQHGRRVDWYTDADQDPVPFSELPPERQTDITEKVDRLLDNLNAVANRYRVSEDPVRAQLGAALQQAIARPGKANLFDVGGLPVMAFWGFAQDDPLPELSHSIRSQKEWSAAQNLETPTISAPPPLTNATTEDTNANATERDALATGNLNVSPSEKPIIRHVETASNRYVVVGGPVFLSSLGLGLGLLLLALGLWIGGLLPPRFAAFASLPSGPAASDSTRPADALAKAKAEEGLLRSRIAERTNELAGALAACQVSEQSQQSSLGSSLFIPKDAAQKQDFSFLKGRWISVTGLKNKRSGVPIEIEYVFDAQANGLVTVHEKNGMQCKGETKAVFDSAGRLVLEDSTGPKCNDSTQYNRSRIVCDVEPNGKASCQGEHHSGGTFAMGLHRG